MDFAPYIIFQKVNLLLETTMGTFANSKSFYDVIGKESINHCAGQRLNETKSFS